MSKYKLKVTSAAELERILDGVIESAAGLNTNECYSRTHDDHEGEWAGKLTVILSGDGDTWVQIDTDNAIRFRNVFGGTNSRRTHNALVILAKAIAMDNADRPEPCIVTPGLPI